LGGGVKFTLSTTLSVMLLFGLLALGQGSRNIPAGTRHAQELETQNETTNSAPRSDPASLWREADQLARLAASVPPDVQNVNEGLLSKDLIHKLKQIEKLSKHLRNELDH
jgi:hypothetical protein